MNKLIESEIPEKKLSQWILNGELEKIKTYFTTNPTEIKNKLESISDYDTIYIGGPVWWSHYPMCMFTCLENLDFTGKTIYPFTTHEGSALGDVMDDIKKLCSGANIKAGLAIRGSDANNSLETLESWCK